MFANYYLALKKTIPLFKELRLILVMAAASLGFFLINLWIANYQLFWSVLTSSSFSVWEKLTVLAASFGLFTSNFTFGSQVLIVLSSLLGGITVSILFVQMSKQVASKNTGAGLGGVVLSMVGVGCGACGSIILSTLFGLSAGQWLTALLPFKGVEFGVLGILILVVSIVRLSYRLHFPQACKLPS